MSETKFHPGPWNTFRADPALAPNSYVVDSAEYRVAQSIHDRFDACLIAAAPELYEALDTYLKTYARTDHHPNVMEEAECINIAHAALARARGESK